MRDWYARGVLFLIRPALERHGVVAAVCPVSRVDPASLVLSDDAVKRQDNQRKVIRAHVELQQRHLAERVKQQGVVL